MARLFQALVVLGGGVVGCGRTVDRLENVGAAGDDSETGAAAGSTAMNPMGTGGRSSGGMPLGGTTSTGGAINAGGVVSTGGAGTVTPPGGAAPTAQGGAGALLLPEAGTGSGAMDVGPAPAWGGAAARGPDDCPPARWLCETLSCSRDATPHCGIGWTGEIENCPEVSASGCACSSDLAESASDCVSGEVFTCRIGRFEAESDSDAGGAELLPYECRCVPLPRGAECVDMCETHGAGGYQRACVNQGDLVLCGGCIYTGILR